MRKMFFRVTLGFLLLLALAVSAAYFFPQRILTVDSGPVKAGVIIILGGGGRERPARAAELFKDHVAPGIIITGTGDDQINRRFLLQAGVPASAIQVEGKSTTTRENALFTIKLLRAEKIHDAILVTTWYHSRRALRTFEHFAPEIEFYSRPSYFIFDRKGVQRAVFLEYVKMSGYWICYGVWFF